MAKKKTGLPVEETSFTEIDRIISNEFKNLIDLSKVDTKVKTWLDIGIYALNYICSKNLFGAIPVGRVSSIDGLTGTAKSLLVSSLMKDSQLDYILLIETEGGGNSAELLEFAGVDLKKVRVIKANTFENYKMKKSDSSIEEVNDNKFPKNKKEDDKFIYKEGATRIVRRFLNAIEFNKINKNILMVIDSLGNLSSVREFSGTPDMGAKPKAIATFFRSFDLAFERSSVSFIFTNKLYTNIGNKWEPWKVTGGVNTEYNPSLSIRLTDTSETDDIADKDMKVEKERRKSALGSSLKTVRAKIVKSRFGTEMRQVPFLLDFSVGPVRYSGLFTLLQDFGVITKVSGAYYKIDGIFNDKSFYKKDFVDLMTKKGKDIESAHLDILQQKLEKREYEIKEGKVEFQSSGMEPTVEESSEEVENEEFSDLKKAMTRDVEK